MSAGPRAVLELNTRLFRNCFAGVDDAAALRRIDGRTNNMAFLGCHLVDARVYLERLLGGEPKPPFGGRLEAAKSLDDLDELPALDEILAEWAAAAERLDARLADATGEALAAEGPPGFPIADRTLGGAVAFLLEHESFHLGQLALLRRWLGLPAMEYG